MNILVINHYAGSPKYGMEFRHYYIAREWLKLGHRITIIGAGFSHLRSSQPLTDRNFSKEDIDGITYLWVKTPRYSCAGAKRIVNMITFISKLFWYKSRILQQSKPDIVIASSTYPLDIYPAYLIAKKSKAKLVFELHDMWPLSPIVIGGYSKFHPFIWSMQKAENFACRKSSAYISLLSNAKDYLVQHGLNTNKFFYVPNGFSIDDVNLPRLELADNHESLLNKLKQKEQALIIGYAGGHEPSNALENLISAAVHFSKLSHLSFVLVGSGSQREKLMSKVITNNQNNVFFIPQVSKAEIPCLLSHFDILYAGGVSSILHSYGTSFNKLTDYMLAAKPIIFAVDEPNSLVETVGCGIQIPAENENELVIAIRTLLNLSSDERLKMGLKGRDFAMNELNYTKLSKRFIEILESIS